jgi:hypothetical protein
MNQVLRLQYKTKVGMLLGAMLLLLLLNNIAGQQSFARMQKDATAIYEDRLMPSTFLFDISEQLYQERLILSSGAAPAAMNAALRVHSANIAELIRRYEKTALTNEERREWNAFKTHLQYFQSASELSPVSTKQFEMALIGLNNLKAIQAGEGAYLQKDMTRIGTNSSLRAYLEMVLLIVIGAITLSLIGFSKNVFEETVSHHPSLN